MAFRQWKASKRVLAGMHQASSLSVDTNSTGRRGRAETAGEGLRVRMGRRMRASPQVTLELKLVVPATVARPTLLLCVWFGFLYTCVAATGSCRQHVACETRWWLPRAAGCRRCLATPMAVLRQPATCAKQHPRGVHGEASADCRGTPFRTGDDGA